MTPLHRLACLTLLLAATSCSAGADGADAGAAQDAAAAPAADAAQGPDAAAVGQEDGGAASDAGRSDAGPECVAGAPPAPCCDGSGTTRGEGICANGAWVCGAYRLCECAGQRLTWQCADACGSDAWASPTCEAAGWTCPGGTRRTDTCPAGLCWSEGPQCCSDAGVDWPTCINGVWQCSAGLTPCP